jgi:class 3 adenylate cyclase
VPTLVLHRRDTRYHRVAFGRYLAQHIAGAWYVELDGADSFPFHAGDFMPVLDQVEQFLTGMRASPALDRTLATVLMTDIVDSTGCAARLSDHRWLELRAAHDRLVREQIAWYRGREVDATGDGFLALFDGPTRAVNCATEITQRVRALGLEIRAGLHTGEVEVVDGKPGGIALHIASRVMMAAANEGVYASSTVRDLVVGSGMEFIERGHHNLKGVPGNWVLFEVGHLS